MPLISGIILATRFRHSTTVLGIEPERFATFRTQVLNIFTLSEAKGGPLITEQDSLIIPLKSNPFCIWGLLG
jgi:hypothetical protein